MFFKIHLVLLLLIKVAHSNINGGFTFNGNLMLGGTAEVRRDGLFKLTNGNPGTIGHAFYSQPFSFKNSSNGNALSFSTAFVFSLVPQFIKLGGPGMAFVIAPSNEIPGALPYQYLGLFNKSNYGNPSNHIVAIEFDTKQNMEFNDINDNHVGIDINSLASIKSIPAAYFSNESGEFKSLYLKSGDLTRAWVDYDGVEKQLNVTISPINIDKPSRPLLSLKIDISPFILDQMYVGFSSSTCRLKQYTYILGWSFQLNGKAEELDISHLPSIPRIKQSKKKKKVLEIGLSAIGVVSVSTTIFIIIFLGKRKAKFADIVEDWEVQYGPHRYQYEDLFLATKGFKDAEFLGSGGFGEVYRGVLPVSNTQVAVKRISHKSRQGMKEFVAEIATIGRVRHPNLVRLLGYCRRKGELLLVYDFMANGSLDKFLFNDPKAMLDWNQRLKIIKDVASGLAYLHEEWVEVIIHRDIKASNVLLDDELNAKLGDFGLARCIARGNDPQTTHVAGTLGYIAPELARNGKATKNTDVFAFGAFCLEVVCGRRPVEQRALPEEVVLVDWVAECYCKQEILQTIDLKLKNDLKEPEMELVLKLGLFCSHPVAAIRPSMSQVLQYLKGDASLPENLDALVLNQEYRAGLNDCDKSHNPASQSKDSKLSVTITEMFITSGR
ncbi:L-type lectin-domain containing receptor kinase V.9-like [Cornus florida]|uniref:L-type lectin-domain containing receptor kinase V.9-like n=1 Tax=Cornus florida TaxID=4283 RepID=UPI0028A1C1AD|nr:L-type lectin-domain containing receptor kinase V.9-like [Cornus florida]